jgi:glutamate dehydrogenase
MGVDSAERYLANFVATSRDEQIGAVDKLLGKQLAKVASLDEDRILRAFASVIKATLRTSFYQTEDRQGKAKDYFSFKFDPSQVPDIPKPVPYREIFVYSPFVEGVHLSERPIQFVLKIHQTAYTIERDFCGKICLHDQALRRLADIDNAFEIA